MLLPDEVMKWLTSESEQLADTVSNHTMSSAVPGCPDWTLRDLVLHLGRVQRFWAEVVKAGANVRPTFQDASHGPEDARSLQAWMRASTEELLSALRTSAWDSPAWAWWKEPRTVGAIARHQVQEAGVHRWDAGSAVGHPEPVPDAVAADAIAEFLKIASQMRPTVPIEFTAVDLDCSYRLTDSAETAKVSGTASDLLLLLYRRKSLDEVSVTGDRATVEGFLVPID